MMNFFFLLVVATFGVCAAQASCVHCTSCSHGNCVVCNPGYYELNGVCVACGSIACPATKYYSAAACGTQHPFDNGCIACVDCVANYGERTKAWGVCGGPDNTQHPDPDVQKCLNPGPALCNACSDHVPEWAWTNNKDPDKNISYCPSRLDNSWWFLTGKTESDLGTCCQQAKDMEDGEECVFLFPDEVLSPVAAHKSCLYNHVITCMGIYDSNAGGWPLPSDYPADPMPW